MKRKIFWRGLAPRTTCFFPATLFGGHDMTAISIVYDPPNGRFVIAADGRCALGSPDGRTMVKTDTQRKIFHVANRTMNLAYSMSGFAGSMDGTFETVAEAEKQISNLSKRQFDSGYAFAEKFSFNMTKVLEKAMNTRRLSEIPSLEGLSDGEKGRKFKFYLLGYYRDRPFWTEIRFYSDEKGHGFGLLPKIRTELTTNL
jgi:hypothetical protein